MKIEINHVKALKRSKLRREVHLIFNLPNVDCSLHLISSQNPDLKARLGEFINALRYLEKYLEGKS